jgi:hypothetical protein
MPSPSALCFEELVELHGEPITIVNQTVSGYNYYGHPVKTETSYAEPGFLRQRPGEATLPPGHIKKNNISVLLKQWIPVEEELCELEIEEKRYHITGLAKTEAYMEVLAEREVPG